MLYLPINERAAESVEGSVTSSGFVVEVLLVTVGLVPDRNKNRMAFISSNTNGFQTDQFAKLRHLFSITLTNTDTFL